MLYIQQSTFDWQYEGKCQVKLHFATIELQLTMCNPAKMRGKNAIRNSSASIDFDLHISYFSHKSFFFCKR